MGAQPEGREPEPEDVVEPAADEQPDVVAHSIGSTAESEEGYGADGSDDGSASWCIGASSAR